jgi:cell division protein FtsQ
MRRGCGTLTYRRNRKKSRKAPVVREMTVSRHRQLFLLFLFTVSQFFFFQSSMFVVRDVVVKGEDKIAESSILATMGLGKEASYWELSAQNLQADILELNGLESAQVELIFPGRVAINVSERKPVFTVSSLTHAKQTFTVDKDGVVVGEGQAPKGALRVVLERNVRAGGLLSTDELEVCTYLRSHLRPALAKRLDYVRFDHRGEVTLRLAYRDRKIPIRLGRPEKLSYKLFLLEELLASLKAGSAQVVSIDLRFSTPIVRQPYQKPTTPETAPPE